MRAVGHLLPLLLLGACASDPSFIGGDRADEAMPYVGLWTGQDAEQNDCQIEVLSYEAFVDEKVPYTEEDLATRDLSRYRRSMQAKVSFQSDGEAVFDALSTFDDEGTAYSRQGLQAVRQMSAEESETLLIQIDSTSEAIVSFDYTLSEQHRCTGLQRVDAVAPEQVPGEEPAPAEPIAPYEKGRPRR